MHYIFVFADVLHLRRIAVNGECDRMVIGQYLRRHRAGCKS